MEDQRRCRLSFTEVTATDRRHPVSLRRRIQDKCRRMLTSFSAIKMDQLLGWKCALLIANGLIISQWIDWKTEYNSPTTKFFFLRNPRRLHGKFVTVSYLSVTHNKILCQTQYNLRGRKRSAWKKTNDLLCRSIGALNFGDVWQDLNRQRKTVWQLTVAHNVDSLLQLGVNLQDSGKCPHLKS